MPNAKLLFVRRPDRRAGTSTAVFLARTHERGGVVRRLELDGYDHLLNLDLSLMDTLGTAVEHPLLLVCTHGKHDRCCARRGRPLYAALREQVEPDSVWQSSHLGGDRFAGNLVAVREGLYFGRVQPADVFPVLDEYLAGRIHLERYRGRSCYPFAVQAAECAVRERGGHRGIEDLTLLGVERVDGGWSVRFATPAGEVEQRVAAAEGELAYLTCHAETLRHPRRFVATG